MSKRSKTSVALVALILGALAAPASAMEGRADDSIWIGSFGSINKWRAVGRDELIVWSSPSKPYLVKIWRPHTSLRFVNAIGLTSTTGRITKFDRVIVDGQRLPIKSITALEPEIARDMRWTKKEAAE